MLSGNFQVTLFCSLCILLSLNQLDADVSADLQKEDTFVVKADVPGITKDKVNLSLDGDLMTLSIENSSQQEKDENLQGYKVHR